jgi:hypothetical protein
MKAGSADWTSAAKDALGAGPIRRIRAEQSDPRAQTDLRARPDSRDPAAQDYCKSRRHDRITIKRNVAK